MTYVSDMVFLTVAWGNHSVAPPMSLLYNEPDHDIIFYGYMDGEGVDAYSNFQLTANIYAPNGTQILTNANINNDNLYIINNAAIHDWIEGNISHMNEFWYNQTYYIEELQYSFDDFIISIDGAQLHGVHVNTILTNEIDVYFSEGEYYDNCGDSIYTLVLYDIVYNIHGLNENNEKVQYTWILNHKIDENGEIYPVSNFFQKQ